MSSSFESEIPFTHAETEQTVSVKHANLLYGTITEVIERNADVVATDSSGDRTVHTATVQGDHFEVTHTHHEPTKADIYTVVWTKPGDHNLATQIELTREATHGVPYMEASATLLHAQWDGTWLMLPVEVEELVDQDVVAASTVLNESIAFNADENLEARQGLPHMQIRGTEAMEVWSHIAPAVGFALHFPNDIPLSVDDTRRPIVAGNFLLHTDRPDTLAVEFLDISAGQMAADGSRLISSVVAFWSSPFESNSPHHGPDSHFVMNIVQNVDHPERTLVRYSFEHRAGSLGVSEPFALGPAERAQVHSAIANQLEDPANLYSEPPEDPDYDIEYR